MFKDRDKDDLTLMQQSPLMRLKDRTTHLHQQGTHLLCYREINQDRGTFHCTGLFLAILSGVVVQEWSGIEMHSLQRVVLSAQKT